MRELPEGIEIGAQCYLHDGDDPFGAVRDVAPEGRAEIVIYVENGGEFVVTASAIRAAHDGKVVLDGQGLDSRLCEAIAHAGDNEVPGL